MYAHTHFETLESKAVDGALSLTKEIPPQTAEAALYFHCARGFATPVLAYMLDSLVRVSRRVE